MKKLWPFLILDKVDAWFSEIVKIPSPTTISFTCRLLFNYGSSGLSAGTLMFLLHASSGSKRNFGPRIGKHNQQYSLLYSHNSTDQLKNVPKISSVLLAKTKFWTPLIHFVFSPKWLHYHCKTLLSHNWTEKLLFS